MDMNIFVSMEEFRIRKDNGDFIAIEPNIIDGVVHYYAITRFWTEIPNNAELILSTFGIYARLAKENVPNLKLCFVSFKDMSILEKRLYERCLIDKSNFEEKIQLIKKYLEENIENQYDHIIYNDGSIENTLSQVFNLI